MIWYVRRGERERGPLGEEALRALVGTGQVTPDTMLWREGLPDWTAAGALPGVLGPGAAAAPAAPRRGIITPLYWATVGYVSSRWRHCSRLRPQGWHERARYAAVLTPIPILQQELTQAANGVNASTPRMIDNMTRLDGAQAGPGTLFTYEYTLINIRASTVVLGVTRDAPATIVSGRAPDGLPWDGPEAVAQHRRRHSISLYAIRTARSWRWCPSRARIAPRESAGRPQRRARRHAQPQLQRLVEALEEVAAAPRVSGRPSRLCRRARDAAPGR